MTEKSVHNPIADELVHGETLSLPYPLNLEELLVPATRYYMGRTTIAAETHARALARHWLDIPMRIRAILRRDIEKEINRDDAARARSSTEVSYPLGDRSDRASWDLVRAAWLKEERAILPYPIGVLYDAPSDEGPH